MKNLIIENNDDYIQAGKLSNIMNKEQKNQLIKHLAHSLGGAKKEIQNKNSSF